MSSSGVLFTHVAPLPLGEPVEYLITLPPGEAAGKPVTLRCLGKVVRHQRAGQEPPTTAVTLERYEFVRDNGSKR